MVRLIINGVNGFMGQAVMQLALSMPEDFTVAAGVDKAPAKTNPFPVYADIFDVREQADVIIDFSRPEALRPLLNFAQLHGLGAVIATTGLNADDTAFMQAQATKIPVFQSANMALGVNLQANLIRQAAEVLGESFDVEIIEKHHHRKVDAPSGTALMLADVVKAASPGGKEYVYDRHAKSEKRNVRELGLHSIRGGTIVGEHEVLFIGPDEIIEVNHYAHSRQIFASGALRAAQFLHDMPAGLYSMNDIITRQGSVSNIFTADKQALITVYGVSHELGAVASLFRALAEVHINIDMIGQTLPQGKQVEISFSLSENDVSKAISTLKHFQSTQEIRIAVTNDVSKITVKGLGMERQSGVAVRVFEVLADAHVSINLITTSETQITLCVATSDMPNAVSAIKKAFGI